MEGDNRAGQAEHGQEREGADATSVKLLKLFQLQDVRVEEKVSVGRTATPSWSTQNLG